MVSWRIAIRTQRRGRLAGTRHDGGCRGWRFAVCGILLLNARQFLRYDLGCRIGQQLSRRLIGSCFCVGPILCLCSSSARSFLASWERSFWVPVITENLFELQKICRRLDLNDGVGLVIGVWSYGFDGSHAQPARIHLIPSRVIHLPRPS